MMEQTGLAGSVSAVLGAGRLKRRLADWKAAFGAAMFISPLIIFCGEGLGQVGALTGAIRVRSLDQCSVFCLTDMFTGGLKD